MEKFLIIIVFIFAIWLCNYWLNKIIKEDEKCTDNKGHNWEFEFKSKGSTGDLGFGISSSWEIDYYKCYKCGKEKTEEIY